MSGKLNLTRVGICLSAAGEILTHRTVFSYLLFFGALLLVDSFVFIDVLSHVMLFLHLSCGKE